MKKRIILFSLLILLLTGCTADYEVTLKEDLSVKEELKVYENRSYYQNKSSSVSEIINRFVTPFTEVLVGSEVADYRKGENAGKYIKTEYQNICDSFKLINASNMFSEVHCNYDDEFVTLKFNDLNDLRGESDTLANAADINNITYNIPFKVVESKNFECIVNEGKTICTTTIKKSEKIGKDYEIKISRLSLPTNNDENKEEKKENKKGLIIFIFIIVALVVGGGILLYKKNKQNKLDY